MAKKVTTEDLNLLLEKLSNAAPKDNGPPKGCFTTRALAAAMGLTRAAIQDRIISMIDSGDVEFVGKCPSVNIAGGRTQIPYYRVIKKKGKK